MLTMYSTNTNIFVVDKVFEHFRIKIFFNFEFLPQVLFLKIPNQAKPGNLICANFKNF